MPGLLAIDQFHMTGWLALVTLVPWLVISGCQSVPEYRQEADDVADRIIQDKQTEAYGQAEPFTIDQPADTLRRRLLAGQNLPTSGQASHGTDALDKPEHWPEDETYPNREPIDPEVLAPWAQGSSITITLLDALQIGARNNREYQSRKEDVFRAALTLDLERNAFRTTYAGLIRSVLNRNLSDPSTNANNSLTMELRRQFENGMSLSSRLVFDVASLLSGDRDSAYGILADATLTIPLLAGSGEHIVTEPLQQAERDVIYSLFRFERFRKTYSVQVASSYLGVLQQIDQVNNAEENYKRLIASGRRARALADAGRLPEIQVDQARQDELRARDRWISSRESYRRQLDNFKITLGLPTDADIELHRDELVELADRARDSLSQLDDDALRQIQEEAEQSIDEIREIETMPEAPPEPESSETPIELEVVLDDPDLTPGGPLELPTRKAIELALQNRRDLQIALGEVLDAERAVFIATDALGARLDVAVSGAVGERRGLGSGDSDNARFRFDRGNYTIAADLDLPWEKTSERNAYRNALISLERQVRSLQELEDSIKLQIRNSLRSLRQARESYQIQVVAVELAERRVRSTDLFLQAGRAEIRDVLEAQESLISAQNALTAALVNYRVAELELQRDMGLLTVNQEGLWREYDPTQID